MLQLRELSVQIKLSLHLYTFVKTDSYVNLYFGVVLNAHTTALGFSCMQSMSVKQKNKNK